MSINVCIFMLMFCSNKVFSRDEPLRLQVWFRLHNISFKHLDHLSGFFTTASLVDLFEEVVFQSTYYCDVYIL